MAQSSKQARRLFIEWADGLFIEWAGGLLAPAACPGSCCIGAGASAWAPTWRRGLQRAPLALLAPVVAVPPAALRVREARQPQRLRPTHQCVKPAIWESGPSLQPPHDPPPPPHLFSLRSRAGCRYCRVYHREAPRVTMRMGIRSKT